VAPIPNLNEVILGGEHRTMSQQRRTWATSLALIAFAALLAGVVSGYALAPRAQADGAPQDGQPDQAIVHTYFQILNAGLLSGAFSALATVYAPDATLIQTNSHNVVTIVHGADNIVAWYTKSFGVGTPAHGMQFTPDTRYPAIQSLAPHVVLTYEFAVPNGFSQGGYCMHVFTIQGGWIYSVHWATYFGPVK
jgi:hypothetical protein